MRIRSHFKILCAGFAILSFLTLCVGAGSPTRVVAVGDVHGAYQEFETILLRMGLISQDHRWAGGTATLVQLGDILDRGPRVRECMDLLMQLEGQADKQRGKVIALLGNHETMNIMGDLRYVPAEGYRSFATDGSEEVRTREYANYLKFLAAHKEHSHSQPGSADDASIRRKWMEEHPPGFFEYRDAIGPRGEYGRWLRKHSAVVRIGDGLFVHGGLNPRLPFKNINELDAKIRSEITNFDTLWQSLSEKKVIWKYMKLDEATRHMIEELNWIRARGRTEDPDSVQQMQGLLGFQSWMAVSPDGPLWYRGLALEPEEKLAGDFTAMLVRLKADYIVAGHTVESKGDIVARFDKHVFLIDTGMLKEAYRGKASALEIENGRISAYHGDGEPRILVAPAGGTAGSSPAQEPGYGAGQR